MKLLAVFTGICVAFILMLPFHEAQGKDGVRSGEPAAPEVRTVFTCGCGRRWRGLSQ